MELMKQMRVRFSGLGQDSQDLSSTRERRIPPQKTQSFKTEKKTQNWFWRQMSRDADTSDDIEFKTAVAAAAFAVASLEEADQLNKQRRRASSTEAVETSLDKTKTKKEEQSTAKTSRRLTIKEVKEDSKSSTGGTSMKKPEATDKKMAEKIPITQKVPSYPEEKEKGTSSMKHTSTKDSRPFPDTKPITPISSNQQKESSKEKGKMDTQADTWERIKLAKIQKSYEKVKSSILSWEGERKAKARSRLDKRERELETKRANASHEYRMEIARIEKIAAEARAVAEEKKRKDEKKTKEKARRFRSTGKPPVTCFFF